MQARASTEHHGPGADADPPVDEVTDGPAKAQPADSVGPTRSAPAASLGRWLLIYSLLRVGLLVVLAAGLSLLMPLILALLFAVVLALPLSWVLFTGVRQRVNAAMATSTAHRRQERERLRAALNGEELP